MGESSSKLPHSKGCRSITRHELYHTGTTSQGKHCLCQSSLKMSPFLPRLKCPLGGLGRAWRGGCWSGAWHRVFGGAGRRSGSAHRASGGDRALEHLPPRASDGFLRPTLVGVLLVGLRAWARVRHVDRLLLRNAARTLRSGNFFPGQALSAIPHFQSSVGGLVDQRFASRAVTALVYESANGT